MIDLEHYNSEYVTLFIRAGEGFLNKGTSKDISFLFHERKTAQVKIFLKLFLFLEEFQSQCSYKIVLI